MTRKNFESYIHKIYGVSPDYPWMGYPEYAVFRHAHNQKWFCVVMKVSKARLGINAVESIDIVNLKCEHGLADFLWQENGVYPAYHMNKWHWVSVALDGSADTEMLKRLLDTSFKLTAGKMAKDGKQAPII